MMYNETDSPLAALTGKIGGESQLNSFVLTFSERVLKDSGLQVAFKEMDAETLSQQMVHLIKTVFGYSKSSIVESNIGGQIVLRNSALFELGLSRPDLRKFQLYFAAALKDSLVEGEVWNSCNDRFAELCRILEAESRSFHPSNKAISNDPSMKILQ